MVRLTGRTGVRECAALVLALAILAPVGHSAGAASPGLGAGARVASGLTMTAQTRPGPYFAGEAIAIAISLQNSGTSTVSIQQVGACRFAAQINLLGQPIHGTLLPPSPLCSGPGLGTIALAPGARMGGTAMAVVPVKSGAPGTSYSVQLRITTQVVIGSGTGVTTLSLLGRPAPVTAVGPAEASGALPAQTLRATAARDADGFTIAVHDALNRPVTGVAGWYVVQAPDGPLAWSATGVGRVLCGAGCAGGAAHGTYRFSVTLVRDGYTVATASTAYNVS